MQLMRYGFHFPPITWRVMVTPQSRSIGGILCSYMAVPGHLVAKLTNSGEVIKLSYGDKIVTHCGLHALLVILRCIRAILTAAFMLLAIFTTMTAKNPITQSGVLSDDLCDRLCAAAREKSQELGVEISFAIADPSGLPRVFRRFSDALVLSTTLVPAKPIRLP